MAKIEVVHEKEEHFPETVETIEVRVWGAAGKKSQAFFIGSGLNFAADANLWVEFLYSVNGAQIFYTRNFVHHDIDPEIYEDVFKNQIDTLIEKQEGQMAFAGMLPETAIIFKAENKSYADYTGEQKTYSYTELEITADTGPVFGRSGPGGRAIKISLPWISIEEGVRFMSELKQEMDAAAEGKHPNPASFPEGSSEWPFVWQANRLAYDRIASEYDEAYFENPLLTAIFDKWMANLPAGGSVLDAGCGHGQPVIARLLERGFTVTGSDFSEAMLERAAGQFPLVTFLHAPTTQIPPLAQFDGVCSFNSMLYLDPIDFLNSLHRLRSALKPGGLLFLHAWDPGPSWCGLPYSFRLDQWMWSWHYGMEEAARLVEEHGFFEVLEMQLVHVDPEEEERINHELAQQKQEEEEYYREQKASNPDGFIFPYMKMPVLKSPYGYAIVARRCGK